MRKVIGFSLALVFLVLAIVGCGGPSATKDFSAEIVTKAGGRVQRGKIYMSGKKWRMDVTAYGQKSTTIVRADKKAVYILMPAQKMYMEQKYSAEYARGMGDMTKGVGVAGKVEHKKIGREKVSGIMCDKYKITSKVGGRKTVIYQWIAKDSLFPIKSAAADGSWSTQFKNFKAGKQPGSLFELPAGYKKFKMPSIPGM
jgi:hypothetical protein